MPEIPEGTAPFIRSLYKMLTHEDTNVLAWREDGLAFRIFDQKQLASEILPKYFRHSNYSSFQRQLNYFGFHKSGRSPPASSRRPESLKPAVYSRVHFTRHCPMDLKKITRKTRSTGMKKTKPNTTFEQMTENFAIIPSEIQDVPNFEAALDNCAITCAVANATTALPRITPISPAYEDQMLEDLQVLNGTDERLALEFIQTWLTSDCNSSNSDTTT